MKKIFTLAVLFAAVAMVACGGQNKKANNAEEQVAVECAAENCEECAEKDCCEQCAEAAEAAETVEVVEAEACCEECQE